MPETKLWTNSEEFHHCLSELRAKTGLVPEQHRAAFRREINSAHRLYERAQQTFAMIEDMVDDLHQVVGKT